MGAIDQVKRILIVDRDVISTEPLRQGLCAAGFAVRSIAGETAALGSLEDRPSDLAIVDWSTGPGLDFVGAVLRPPLRSATRLIIASALSDEQDVVRGLGLGADDYIVKPFSIREAVARVRAVLRTRNRASAPACKETFLPRSPESHESRRF